MKIKTLVVCLFVLFAVKSFSQSYIPFVQEGKMWTEIVVSPNPIYNSIVSYSMSGDTIIASKSYKKLIATYGPSMWVESFLIYEDTLSKKVYLYDMFSQQDSLIYNFSLSIGESYAEDLSCSDTVVNKSTVYFAGRNRTKIEFNYSLGISTWFEGIGNIYGVMRPISFCILGSNQYLLCYFENGELLYQDTTFNDDCFVNYDLFSVEKESLFNLYFSEDIMLLKSKSKFPYTLCFYDLFGRKLCQISASGDMEKDFSNLPAGMYLWRVESKGESGVFSGKFLKD